MELQIQSRTPLKEGMNIAPLIDVVFILLIFFMLTSTFLVEEGIDVSLPQASSGESLQSEIKSIGIDAAGVIHMDGRIISAEELLGRVEALIAANKDQAFAIKSDRSVQVSLLVQVIDTLRKGGASNLTIQTDMQ